MNDVYNLCPERVSAATLQFENAPTRLQPLPWCCFSIAMLYGSFKLWDEFGIIAPTVIQHKAIPTPSRSIREHPLLTALLSQLWSEEWANIPGAIAAFYCSIPSPHFYKRPKVRPSS